MESLLLEGMEAFEAVAASESKEISKQRFETASRAPVWRCRAVL